MDLNYDVNSLEFSLAQISAVKVVQQILLASGRALVASERRAEIEADAAERVRRLDVPRAAKGTLEMLIKPINDELDLWYCRRRGFCTFGSPVFTPQGTLNVVETTRTVVENEDVDICIRFAVACGFCHERNIFEIFARLTTDEVVQLSFPQFTYFTFIEVSPILLCRLWLDALRRGIEKRNHGRVLPQAMCDESFDVAMDYNNGAALRYFIDKASPEMVQCIVQKYYCWNPEVWPATYCVLFSKLGEDQRGRLIGRFARVMLLTLLNWPFQRWYLRAAGELTSHLDRRAYWEVLEGIARKAALGYKDYDYAGLFAAFWKLGAVQRRELSLSGFMGHNAVFLVCMTGDEKLIGLVLRDVSAEDKEELLTGFHKNMICSTLLCKRDHKSLELFVRGCAADRKDLLTKFRDSFVAEARVGRRGMRCFEFWQRILEEEAEEWMAEKSSLAEIVDRIVVEDAPPKVVP